MGDEPGFGRKKVRSMKGIKVLLLCAIVALVAVTVPFASQKAYAADYGNIERLVPAESPGVETGGGEIFATAVGFEKLTGVAGICPAETAAVETGGTLWPARLAPMDAAGRIELCPAAK